MIMESFVYTSDKSQKTTLYAHYSSVKKEAAGSSERLVPLYEYVRFYDYEEYSLLRCDVVLVL
jgi:hypothetical protein